MKKFREESSTDKATKVIMDYVLRGWPTCRDQVDELAREYWKYK